MGPPLLCHPSVLKAPAHLGEETPKAISESPVKAPPTNVPSLGYCVHRLKLDQKGCGKMRGWGT